MTLRRDGFVYKVTFTRRFTLDDLPRVPEKMSLCSLFWRFMWSLFIVQPLIWGVLSVFATVVSICSFLFGYRLCTQKERDQHENGFVPICNALRIIKPIYPLMMLWFWYGGRLWYHHLFLGQRLSDMNSFQAMIAVSSFAVAAVLVVGICTAAKEKIIAARKQRADRVLGPHLPSLSSDIWWLFKRYLKAQKEKVCPIVEFK